MPRATLPETKAAKRQLFIDALTNSFHYRTDELDCSKSFARKRTTKSFNEVLELCLNGNAFWTILFRNAVSAGDFEYWEFGAVVGSSVEHFIWINVRTDLAEKLFEIYSLKIIP